MSFASFWETLTTSPYERLLAKENADLRQQVKDLTAQNAELAKLAMKLKLQESVEEGPLPTRRVRPGRFQSFGQAKRVAERYKDEQ